LKSKVLIKVVHISDKDEICFCEKSFSKTCSTRIVNNLPCEETLIRFTSIEREDSNVLGTDALEKVDEVERGLKNLNREFFKTLKHLDRMK
jgi:hypothetical protein